MMECHFCALPRTPFCHYVAFHPQGSVSLDSRVASLPYESSSLATSRGNKEFEEKNRESYTSCTILAFPLWWLAPPPCPVGSMSLDSRVAYSSPMNPVPLPPPQFGGAAKGKRLNGQARRLTSPHLEVLCRTSTGALWVLSNGAMSLQESIERFILSPGWGESPAQPDKGEPRSG